jgi:phosphoserine aminotransferase
MTERIFNFAPGPSVLPLPVLEQAQRDLLALPGVGMSVLEISHRSSHFDEIIGGAESGLRRLAGISDDYAVLFLQGGASLQFAMVPMNLMPRGGSADYIVTGSFAKKAFKEARLFGPVRAAGSTEAENFTRVCNQNELDLDPDAAYVHFTTNNTIFGTEWTVEPEVGNVPLVADASSDILSRPLETGKYALIYAGAQKNLAPAGLTLVIIRKDLLERSPADLPTMLNYNTYAKERSLYNTPPVFAIYIMNLVLKQLIEQGGLDVIGKQNAKKAKLLYDAIDSGSFYRGHAQAASRSSMNVTFRLPGEDLEKKFIAEAGKAGLDGLKGHRSVGGCRASIYNAFPIEGVEALVSFMKEFERTNG